MTDFVAKDGDAGAAASGSGPTPGDVHIDAPLGGQKPKRKARLFDAARTDPEVGKAFDPHQPRGKGGQWTAGAGVQSYSSKQPHAGPKSLHGVAMRPWKDAPTTAEGWATVEGQNHGIDEPALPDTKGKIQGSGLIIHEPDGRVWLTKPTNGFGGYKHSWPKGGVDAGLHPQANAIKEAYEETGLKAKITGFAGDHERDTSVARYYHAVRTGGDPRAHGWESEAVVLAPPDALHGLLNRHVDQVIAHQHAGAPEPPPPPPPAKPKGKPGAVGFDGKPLAIPGPFSWMGDKKPLTKARLFGAIWPQRAVMFSDLIGKGYNPDQPRGKGGQWTAGAGWHAGIATGKWSTGHAGANAAKAKVAAIDAIVNHPTMSQGDKLAALGKIKQPKLGLKPNAYQKAITTAIAAAVAHVQTGQQAAVEHTGIMSTGHLTKTGGQLGSNPGYQAQDADGGKFYVKQSKSDDHAKNEVLAARLYELAGAGVVKYHLADVGGGKLGTATAWDDSLKALDTSDVGHLSAHQANFAVHAWLANWDAVGLSYDNASMKGGQAVTMDTGGSLLYRAQGAEKGHLFGNDVKEWDSLRDGSNAQAAAVFGAMTGSDLKAAAAKVAAIDPAAIHATVMAHGPGDEAARKALADKLVARRADIINKANAIQGEPVSAKAADHHPVTEPPTQPLQPAPKPAGMSSDKALETMGRAYGALSFTHSDQLMTETGNGAGDKVKAALMAGDHAALKAVPFATDGGQAYQAKLAVALKHHLAGTTPPPEAAAPSSAPAGPFPVPGHLKGYDKAAADAALKIAESNYLSDKEKIASLSGSHNATSSAHAKEYIKSLIEQLKQKAMDEEPEPVAAKPPRDIAPPVVQQPVAPALPEKPLASGFVTGSNANHGLLKKLDAMHATAEAWKAGGLTADQAKAAIGSHQFGSNTYGKKAAKHQTNLLAHIGAVGGGAQAPAQPAAAAPAPTPAAKPAKAPKAATPAPTPAPKVDPAKLEAPPTFSTSKVNVKAENEAHAQALLDLAKTGDLTGLKSYDKFSPMSGKLQAFKDTLIQQVADMLNPPRPMVYTTISGTVKEISDACPPYKGGTKLLDVPKSQHLGFYIALGKANQLPALPPVQKLSKAWEKEHAYDKYPHISDLAKSAISGIQGGSFQGATRNSDWNSVYHKKGTIRRHVDAVVKEFGTEMPHGTVLTAWTQYPPSMRAALISGQPGTILQETGTKCASTGDTLTSHFGLDALEIHCGAGVIGLPVFGSKNSFDSSEHEVTMIPGTRYILHSVEDHYNPHYKKACKKFIVYALPSVMP